MFISHLIVRKCNNMKTETNTGNLVKTNNIQ